jgi:hypothetical protein
MYWVINKAFIPISLQGKASQMKFVSISTASLIVYGINKEILNDLSINLYDQNVILVPLNAFFCLIWFFFWLLCEIICQPHPDGSQVSDESS